jgi:AhpD family alkylhydroperoxidase
VLARCLERLFQEFTRRAFTDGALAGKTKQLIAVAVAQATQCPYCIRGHIRPAKRHGASEQEIMEAIWVAAEMRAGGVGSSRGTPARSQVQLAPKFWSKSTSGWV